MCAAALDEEAIQVTAHGAQSSSLVRSTLKKSPRGATMYINPSGGILPGFTLDRATGERKTVEFLQQDEGILYADMDLDECVEGKQFHDVAGGYQRLDVFDLQVMRQRRSPVTFIEGICADSSGDPM